MTRRGTLLNVHSLLMLNALVMVLTESVSSSQGHWVGILETGPLAPDPPTADEGALSTVARNAISQTRTQQLTIPQAVHPSIAGARVRVVVTKRFGEKPLKVDAAQLARRQSKLKIDAGADLLFDGQPNIKFEYANPEPSKRMTHLPTGERVQETLARNTVINTR